MKSLVKIVAIVVSFMGYGIKGMSDTTSIWQKPYLVSINIYAVSSEDHKSVCFAKHPPQDGRAIKLLDINVPETTAQELMEKGPQMSYLVPKLCWDDKNEILYYDDRLVYAGNNVSPTIRDGTCVIIENAFYKCRKLQKISIPSSVHFIGNNAFGECSQLSEVAINFDEGKIEFSLGCCAFYECTNLVKVKLPTEMSTIPLKAFYNCSNLKNINIPINISFIDRRAFYGCKLLNSVGFPVQLKHINSEAFGKCSLLKMVCLFSDCTVESNAFEQNVNIVTIRKGDIMNLFYCD